jgi:hypothetical protein
MHECGHAIYPEAHISVDKNAKLVLSLGINDFGSDRMDPSPSSWTKHEERTRAWWGVIILDRYVLNHDFLFHNTMRLTGNIDTLVLEFADVL